MLKQHLTKTRLGGPFSVIGDTSRCICENLVALTAIELMLRIPATRAHGQLPLPWQLLFIMAASLYHEAALSALWRETAFQVNARPRKTLHTSLQPASSFGIPTAIPPSLLVLKYLVETRSIVMCKDDGSMYRKPVYVGLNVSRDSA